MPSSEDSRVRKSDWIFLVRLDKICHSRMHSPSSKQRRAVNGRLVASFTAAPPPLQPLPAPTGATRGAHFSTKGKTPTMHPPPAATVVSLDMLQTGRNARGSVQPMTTNAPNAASYTIPRAFATSPHGDMGRLTRQPERTTKPPLSLSPCARSATPPPQQVIPPPSHSNTTSTMSFVTHGRDVYPTPNPSSTCPPGSCPLI